MKIRAYILGGILCVLPGLCSAQAASTETGVVTQQAEGSAEADAPPSLRRSNRMDFDGRLIKGEKAKGSVYLFQRAQRRLPPLLKLERDGIDRIVYPVLRRNADPLSPTTAVGTTAPKPKASSAPKTGASKAKKKRAGKKKRKRRWKKPKKAKQK